MRKAIQFLLIIFIVAGCSDDSSNKFSIDQSASGDGASDKTSPLKYQSGINIGIGDVESNMRLFVLLDESSYSPTVAHSEELTKLEWVARASADVGKPYPEKLNVLIFNRSVISFPGHSYRTTVNLYREDEIVYTHKYITGKQAKKDIQEIAVDVMPFLQPEPGKSVLLHVRAQIEFFKNTDEETMTVDSPATDNVARAIKMGNPLRITFLP